MTLDELIDSRSALILQVAELRYEINKLQNQQMMDVDTIAWYRNLAITLGATEDQMVCEYDRDLVRLYANNPSADWADILDRPDLDEESK